MRILTRPSFVLGAMLVGASLLAHRLETDAERSLAEVRRRTTVRIILGLVEEWQRVQVELDAKLRELDPSPLEGAA